MHCGNYIENSFNQKPNIFSNDFKQQLINIWGNCNKETLSNFQLFQNESKFNLKIITILMKKLVVVSVRESFLSYRLVIDSMINKVNLGYGPWLGLT